MTSSGRASAIRGEITDGGRRQEFSCLPYTAKKVDAMSHSHNELWRLLRGEEGQDLVEYAYLTLFIALAGAATLVALQAAVGTTYSATATAADALWEPPNPAAGS
jgi:Flp pilus assembly pilin Flp